MTRIIPKIAAALADLNAALTSAPPLPIKPSQGYRKGKQVSFRDGDVLEEWEVPFDLPTDWPEAAKAPFEAFHKSRQAMQRRMDQSIADHADQETLYDKPRIDKNKLRITGPFSASRPCLRPPCSRWTKACQPKRPTAPSPALAKPRANRSGAMSC